MAGPRTLDAPTVLRLAGLDPALRLLPQALPPSWAAAPHSLHDLQWEPGERCRLVVRLTRREEPHQDARLPGRQEPHEDTRFVSVDLRPDGWSAHDHRDDPGLPGAARAADPDHVRGLLSPCLAEPVRRCSVEAVRYRPASRCVLRYDVEAGPTSTSFYAKVHTPELFAEVARVQQALADAFLSSRRQRPTARAPGGSSPACISSLVSSVASSNRPRMRRQRGPT